MENEHGAIIDDCTDPALLIERATRALSLASIHLQRARGWDTDRARKRRLGKVARALDEVSLALIRESEQSAGVPARD